MDERVSLSIVVTETGMTLGTGITGTLWYQVGSIDIYVDGEVTTCRKPSVHHLAIQAALDGGYRAIELKCVKCQRAEKVKTDLKSLRMKGF